ncbi:sensor histidine kinase [Streptomyces sp. NPDC059533]|uniref:sensor histidine kinase n=1 Tax=unclassified Streptomyces TaxID=2593676 RepID=UPI0036C176B0
MEATAISPSLPAGGGDELSRSAHRHERRRVTHTERRSPRRPNGSPARWTILSIIFGLREHETPGQAYKLRSRLVQAMDETSAALGFAPALRMEGLIDTDVPSAVADEALTVVGVALTNVARHAQATRAGVSIAATVGNLTITVTDDGVGLTEGGRRSGLRNLAERADRLGGRMEVAARDGGRRGTHLEWQVPLAPPSR